MSTKQQILGSGEPAGVAQRGVHTSCPLRCLAVPPRAQHGGWARRRAARPPRTLLSRQRGSTSTPVRPQHVQQGTPNAQPEESKRRARLRTGRGRRQRRAASRRARGKRRKGRGWKCKSPLCKEPFTAAQRKGQKLCAADRIHFFLSKKKMDELRNLHELLYNRAGTVSSLKKNVDQMLSFPFEKGNIQYKKKEEMLKEFRNAMFKST